MSYSQEIQLKISADTTQAAKKISGLAAVAQAAGQRVDAAMSGNLAAAKKLSELRTKTAFNELNTIGKIKSITGELAGLVKTRNTLEQGSTKHLEIQTAILQRQTRLIALQRQAAKERFAANATPSGGGGGGGGGAETGADLGSLVAGGVFKRMIFMGAGAVMGGIMNGVSGYFSRQANRSQEQEALAAHQLTSAEQQRIAIGGTGSEAKVLQDRMRRSRETEKSVAKEIKDMEGEVGFEAKMALNSDYRGIYEDKQKKLNELKMEQADYGREIELVGLKEAREIGIAKAQKRSIEEVTKAQKEGLYTTAKAAEIKLREAEAVQKVLEGDTGFGFMGKKYPNRPTGTPEEIRQQRQAVAELRAAYEVAQRLQTREIALNKIQAQSLDEVAKAQLEGSYNAVKAANIKVAQERRVLAALKATGALPEEIRKQELAQKAAESNAAVARMGMRERGFDVRQGLTQEVAGEQRTFPNGMPRPLSETERLAKQAIKARQQARSAILTGAPGEAAYQQQRALGLESSVANRLSEGSSQMRKIETTDATALSGKLETANQLLQAISNSLTTTQAN